MAERSYAIFAITFAETETVKLFALFIGCGHAQRTRASERGGEKGEWSSPVPTDQSGQFMHGESLQLSTNESCSYVLCLVKFDRTTWIESCLCNTNTMSSKNISRVFSPHIPHSHVIRERDFDHISRKHLTVKSIKNLLNLAAYTQFFIVFRIVCVNVFEDKNNAIITKNKFFFLCVIICKTMC